MPPTVTIVSGGVSPTLLSEIEKVFSVFQDKLLKARNAERHLAEQIKLQEKAGKAITREIINETNKNIYFILKQAQMNERKMWEIIKNMEERHEDAKSQIYEDAKKTATAMASELAVLSKHHESMEEEYISHLNFMQDKLKAKDAEFENLKKQMSTDYEKKIAKAMENRHKLMDKQDTKHLENMQYIQDMINRSNNHWEVIFQQVNKEYTLRLKELNNKASATLKARIGKSYKETMSHLKEIYESQDSEWRDMMKQVSENHINVIEDMQQKSDPVITSNQEQHQQMVDLMARHNFMQMEQAKEDVEEVLQNFDEEFFELQEAIRQNHTLELALENHMNNNKNNDNNNNTDYIANDNDNNDNNIFDENLPVFENEKNDWMDNNYINNDVNQEVNDQTVSAEPYYNASNNGLLLPIWAISLISIAGLVVMGLVIFGLFKCCKSKKNYSNNNTKLVKQQPSCSKIPYNDTMELTDETNGTQHPKLNNDMGNITITLEHDNSGGYYDQRSFDPRADSL